MYTTLEKLYENSAAASKAAILIQDFQANPYFLSKWSTVVIMSLDTRT